MSRNAPPERGIDESQLYGFGCTEPGLLASGGMVSHEARHDAKLQEEIFHLLLPVRPIQ